MFILPLFKENSFCTYSWLSVEGHQFSVVRGSQPEGQKGLIDLATNGACPTIDAALVANKAG